jgi:hypothetical protein
MLETRSDLIPLGGNVTKSPGVARQKSPAVDLKRGPTIGLKDYPRKGHQDDFTGIRALGES